MIKEENYVMLKHMNDQFTYLDYQSDTIAFLDFPNNKFEFLNLINLYIFVNASQTIQRLYLNTNKSSKHALCAC